MVLLWVDQKPAAENALSSAASVCSVTESQRRLKIEWLADSPAATMCRTVSQKFNDGRSSAELITPTLLYDDRKNTTFGLMENL